MRGAQSVMLVVVLALGIFLGVHARGGVEPVSQAGPGARASRGAVVYGNQATRGINVASVLAAGGGSSCLSDKDCPEGHVCLGESELIPGECYETCQSAGDCADDGYTCTVAVCLGPVPGEDEEISICGHDYNDAACGHFRETHTVTTLLSTSGNARSLGIHGDCFDEELGPTVPVEECVFTVEAVQYRRDPATGATKFDAVCVDLDTGDSVPTCSPLQRDSLYFSVGPSVGPHFGGEAGIAAGIAGAAWAGFDADLGFSVPITVHRRFRYPMWRRFTGRVGGNILIDTGVGAIVAQESVVFAHNGFDGNVTFFVTKPEGMKLTVGEQGLLGDASCSPGSCPPRFADALEATSGLSGPNSVAGADEFESDFDIEEVIEALDDETQAIDDIIEELKGRIEEKIQASFDIIQDYLGAGGNGASAQQNELVNSMMDLLRGRIRENLEEIRDIARDLVGCPDN